MNTAIRTLAASALLTASTPAFAGVSANLTGSTLDVSCDSSCALVIKPVGSRIHVFELTSGGMRPSEGYYVYDCYQWEYDTPTNLPTRTYSYAAADVTHLQVRGSGKNDYLNVDGVNAFVDIDAGGGNDIVRTTVAEVFADLGSGHDCMAIEAADHGVVYGRSGMEHIYAEGGRFELYGGDDADYLETDDGHDIVFGDAGADTIVTHGGDDDIYGGGGADEIEAGEGDDFVDGGDNGDAIDLAGGDDVCIAGNGNDVVQGGAGNDSIRGNRGQDSITDEDGANEVWGGRDNDTLRVTGAGSVVSGSGGTDKCKAAADVTLTSCERSL